jgi:FixJ family two-component response regulator
MVGESVVHVIDDDVAARQLLTFLLRSAQLTPRAYETGRAFLDAVATAEGGCVITDVRMPDLDPGFRTQQSQTGSAALRNAAVAKTNGLYPR